MTGGPSGAAAVPGVRAFPSPIGRPPPKGGSEDGGRELLVEFIDKRSDCSIAIV